jgi:hypothetical protein
MGTPRLSRADKGRRLSRQPLPLALLRFRPTAHSSRN